MIIAQKIIIVLFVQIGGITYPNCFGHLLSWGMFINLSCGLNLQRHHISFYKIIIALVLYDYLTNNNLIHYFRFIYLTLVGARCQPALQSDNIC